MTNLTEQSIARLADPKIYDRGLKYYKQGRVYDYRENESVIKASVIGSGDYNVTIDFTDFSMICDCPYSSNHSVCKHVVAVLLTKFHGESSVTFCRRSKNTPRMNSKAIKDDFSQFLSSLSRNELIDRIIRAERHIPHLKEYFTAFSTSLDKETYNSLKKTIRRMITQLGPSIRYQDYWSKQRETRAKVISLIEPLPHNETTLEFLLSMGYWITEKLNNIDDSNAILQDLIGDIIVTAIEILDNLGLSAIENIYHYTAMSSSFEYHTNIVYNIIHSSKNTEIITALVNKLDKTRHCRDNDFAFSQDIGIRILLDYYSVHDNQMFEDLANEFETKDIMVKLSYIEFLYNKQRFAEVIKHGWSIRNRYDVEIFIEQSLNRLGKSDELIQFYKEQLSKRIETDKLKKIKTLFLKSGKDNEWHSFANQLLMEDMYITDHLSLLLVLGKHKEIIDLLIDQSDKCVYQANERIKDYAFKFTIINPLMAVRLYRHLMEVEIHKIKRSNYYIRLMEYWRELEELSDIDYLQQTKKQLMASYPTKKKLLEILSEIPY